MTSRYFLVCNERTKCHIASICLSPSNRGKPSFEMIRTY